MASFKLRNGKIRKENSTTNRKGRQVKTVAFKIHGGSSPPEKLRVSKISCNLNNLLTTYYMYINIHG